MSLATQTLSDLCEIKSETLINDLLTISLYYYKKKSLFHQILGVAFFQFAGSLFEIFQQHFSQIIFSSSPNIAENFVEFCCVFCKLDHLACNRILVSR